MKERSELRRKALEAFGRPDAIVEEVLVYCASPFDTAKLADIRFPMADEPHVADWRRYTAEGAADLWGYLQKRIPQLAIPIVSGISQSPEYGAVIRRGVPYDPASFDGKLELEAPGEFEVEIHDHAVGALPVLIAATRQDFEQLCRALASRNEPEAVNPSVNAQMIAGLVNWDRVNRYRASWSEGRDPVDASEDWADEMGRVAKTSPGLFYDRLILITRAKYGGRSAKELGINLNEDAWKAASTGLRMEHEFAHYATKRLYGTMRLNLLDELIADAMGLTHALGKFRSSWFLGALGLRAWPEIPAAARAHTYRSGLSDEAFRLACEVSAHASATLEALTDKHYQPSARGRYLLALTAITLDLLASPEAEAVFDEAWQWAGTVVGG